VQKDALSAEGCGCRTGYRDTWDGILTDFSGDRCTYKISYRPPWGGPTPDFGPDKFDDYAGINHYYTSLHRSRNKECGWLLYIACDHCSQPGYQKYIWAGFGPHFQPWGEYRVLYGCNMDVETLQVEPPAGFVDYFNPDENLVSE